MSDDNSMADLQKRFPMNGNYSQDEIDAFYAGVRRTLAEGGAQMTERDKLEAMAEALEWALRINASDLEIVGRLKELRALAAQQPVGEPIYVHRDQLAKVLNHPFLCRLSMQPGPDMIALYTHPQASAPADHNQDLGVHHAAPDAPSEPIIDGYPLEQGIPPADHTAADAPNREAGNLAANAKASAVGVTPDLDVLWQAAWADYGFIGDRAEARKLYQAITDLRAQLADSQSSVEHCISVIGVQRDSITHLEADNAKARELLNKYSWEMPDVKAFLAKQGD